MDLLEIKKVNPLNGLAMHWADFNKMEKRLAKETREEKESKVHIQTSLWS